MNTELIIKAVNAVIEFNSQDRELPVAAQIEVGKYSFFCRAYWDWNGEEFVESYNEYSYSDEVLHKFINKLQELSQ